MIERQKLRDDLRAVGDSVRTDTDLLDAIEAEKADLDPRNPRAAELAAQASALGDGISAKAHTEEVLVDAIQAEEPAGPPDDEATE